MISVIGPIRKLECSGDPVKRTDCGFSGITEKECKLKGCCFDSSISGVKWCYTRAGTVYYLKHIVLQAKFTPG